ETQRGTPAGAARCRGPVPRRVEGSSVVSTYGVLGFAVDFFFSVGPDAADFGDAVWDDVVVAVDYCAGVVVHACALCAVVFNACDLRVAYFFAGPFARYPASRVAARSSVTASTESSLRRVALVSPAVT